VDIVKAIEASLRREKARADADRRRVRVQLDRERVVEARRQWVQSVTRVLRAIVDHGWYWPQED